MSQPHVVIIGNGISGVTTARHIRKNSDQEITIISAETDYFFSRTALMYIYMGHMTFKNTQPYEPQFWVKNRINLKKGRVTNIDYESKILIFDSGEKMSYDKLVLAVGSKPNKFGWPGQDLKGVQGLYSYQDLESLEKATERGIKRGVIVGGGLIGIELAEMLHSRGIESTFLVREKSFWSNVLPPQESELINRHIYKNHIDLRLGEELDEIIAGDDGWVSKIKTKSGEIIDCEFVGLTAGVGPNVDFLIGGDLAIDRGIVVNKHLETNQPDVYAVGDCAQFSDPVAGRRPMEQVWYTGRIMGETVAQTICGNRVEYNPGHWFNSAKFFDVEYQTYGWVFAELREGEADFYWEHEDGEKCMHFVFDKESRKLLGVNTFGVRLRHHSFNKWLDEEQTIEHVLEHLKDANFDPEFYAKQEDKVVAKFNQENGTNIAPKKKSWKRILKHIQ